MEEIKYLHSPIVNLNYFTYGLLLAAVNNLWAWFTAVAAAIDSWKIKTLSPPRSNKEEDDTAAEEEEKEFRADAEVVDLKKEDNNLTPLKSNYEGGSTKVKFRIRYEEENEREEEEEECESERGKESEGRRRRAGEEGWWWEGEGEWRMRVGDLGWYTCQDRTVLNGSVVRFWQKKPLESRKPLLVLAGGY